MRTHFCCFENWIRNTSDALAYPPLEGPSGEGEISQLRFQLDQPTLGNQRADLILRKSSFAQNLAAMLPQSRRVLSDRRRGLAPSRGGGGGAQGALRRGVPPIKATDPLKIRSWGPTSLDFEAGHLESCRV